MRDPVNCAQFSYQSLLIAVKFPGKYKLASMQQDKRSQFNYWKFEYFTVLVDGGSSNNV
jgi:hypothetical protein